MLESPGRIQVTETLASPQDSAISGMGRGPKWWGGSQSVQEILGRSWAEDRHRIGCIWDVWKAPED